MILALVNHQVGVRHVDGNFCALAADSVEKSFADVEVHGVAKLVGARGSARFDPGREIARVVAAETAAAERAEKVLESFKAEEVDGLVRDLEAGLGLALLRLAELATSGCLRRRSDLRRLLRIDEAFLGQTFH